MLNCKIKRLYAKRERRYFGKSNLGLKGLFEHSLRINSVFFKTVILNSIIYIFVINFLMQNIYGDLIIFLIILFNFLLIYVKKVHYLRDLMKIDKFILNIKSL